MTEGVDFSSGVGPRLKVGIYLNLAFVVVEVVAGLFADSLALISDAWHNLMDVFGLTLAWFGLRQLARPATEEKTFGYHRASILAALANALALIVIVFFVVYEASHRLLQPTLPEGRLMLLTAAVGVAVNLGVALSLKGFRQDLNIRSARFHLLSDAMASLGVIGAGLVVLFTGWAPVDPIVSILIGLLILVGAWGIVKETVNILMEGTPKGVDLLEVARAIRSFLGVRDVHDLHIWSLSSHLYALSCHIQVDDDLPLSASAGLLMRINDLLRARFGIAHSTIQLEAVGCPPQEACSLNRNARDVLSR